MRVKAINRKFYGQGIIKVLFPLLLFFSLTHAWVTHAWVTPLYAQDLEKARPRIFNEPTIAMQFHRADTADQLSLVTARFMEVVRIYDMVHGKTFIPVMYAFLEALDRVQSLLPGSGFGSLRQVPIEDAAFEKFSPL